MSEKRTVIDQIEISRDGFVQIRFALEVVVDGVVVSRAWHRTAIEPGGDVDAQIAAVNADITTRPTLRAQAVDTVKMPLLKSVAQLAHTPEVVAKYRADVAAREQRASVIPPR